MAVSLLCRNWRAYYRQGNGKCKFATPTTVKKLLKISQVGEAIDNREDGSGFVVKITPKSGQSKVLISTVVHIGVNQSAHDARWWGIKLYRKIGSGGWNEVTGAKGESDTTTLQTNQVHISEAVSTGTSVWFSTNQGMHNDAVGTANYFVGNATASYLDTPFQNTSWSQDTEVMYALYCGIRHT